MDVDGRVVRFDSFSKVISSGALIVPMVGHTHTHHRTTAPPHTDEAEVLMAISLQVSGSGGPPAPLRSSSGFSSTSRCAPPLSLFSLSLCVLCVVCVVCVCVCVNQSHLHLSRPRRCMSAD
jgi:hypothetical protein